MTWIWDEFRVVREWAMRYPLPTAFTLSLIIHALLFGGYKFGDHRGWWKHQATWLLQLGKKQKTAAEKMLAKLQPKNLPANRQEIPLTFIEVDPSTAVVEPPKNAKYYGAHSSVAANPDPTLTSLTPKIEGKQEHVPKIQDVPKQGPQPLQPSFPPEEVQRPKPKETPGETIKKPIEGVAEMGAGQKQHERPRTLAKAMEQRNMIIGNKMKQNGGVGRRGKISLDVAGSPFGAYDAAIIAAIQQRWYDLLDNTQFTQRSGKVVIEFRLHEDGRITDLNMTGNEVGELLALLCQRAIMDPAPYPKWPGDMRRMVGKTYREVLFTFYYE